MSYICIAISLAFTMGSPCGFDKLFTRNVLRIHEKIFFSLDYASFRNCHQVCHSWKELLTSKSIHKKTKSVFLYDIVQENHKLNITEKEKKGNEDKLLSATREDNAENVVKLLIDAGADLD